MAAKATSHYRYNFLEEPNSALLCVICYQVAEEPRQHDRCGSLFCKKCLQHLEKCGKQLPCPKCWKEDQSYFEDPQCFEEQKYFEDNRSKKEIQALGVRCRNVDRKCGWVGTVGTLKGHVATCEFTLVPCPKRCRDGSEVQHFMRRDMATHLEKDCPNRDYTCQYKCGEKGTFTYITQAHDVVCEKKKLPCSNAECGQAMERQHVYEHVRTQCPHTVIACKYKGIGCTSRLKRKDMATHEKKNETLHLHMALDAVSTLQDVVQRKCLTDITLKNEESMTFALPDFCKKKQTNEMFTSPSFYTHPGGYHMEVRVYANGNGSGLGKHVSVFIHVLSGIYDAGLKWPFVGKYTFTLLNQLEDKNHYTEMSSIGADKHISVGSNMGKPSFIPHSALSHDLVMDTQYLKDDTLYIRVSVGVDDHKPWLQCTAK